MKLAAFAVLLCASLTLAAGPATLPTQTSDGVAYGDAQPIKGWNPPNLPTIGKMLGVPAAQWVGQRKVITRSHSAAEVDKIESREKITVANMDDMPEFIIVEPQGHYTAFSVDQGCISQVLLLQKTSQSRPISATADNIRNAAKDSKPELVVEANEQPPLLHLKFRRDQWILATHDIEPRFAAAIRAEQVLVGMSEAEADAALFRLHKSVSSEDDGQRIVTYGTIGNYGNTPRVSVKIVAGRVDTVTK